ncbi:MAG: Maf family protein [Desulfobacterales bacterium]
MTAKNTGRKIILASESPRRRRLLEESQIKFRVIPSRIDETAINRAHPVKHARALAEAKAMAVSKKNPDAWVVGADSIVVIDDQILNKPGSAEDAYMMLSLLSGRTHRVITGYSIVCGSLKHFHSDACVTRVTFKKLTDTEIRWYLQTPEPWDKAGAYAVQGTAAFMVKHIQGSYTNVVGLPVCEVVDYLYKNSIIDRAHDIIINGGPQKTAGNGSTK